MTRIPVPSVLSQPHYISLSGHFSYFQERKDFRREAGKQQGVPQLRRRVQPAVPTPLLSFTSGSKLHSWLVLQTHSI